MTPLPRRDPASAIRGLYGMVDVSISPHRTHLEVAEALLQAGSRVLQLRDKGASPGRLHRVLEQLVPRCAAAGATLILNDHVEVASSWPGVGVHLGQDDGDPRDARATLGAGPLIGWSTHDLDQAEAAEALGVVDYIGYGPVFTAATKHVAADDDRVADPAVGIEGLERAVRCVGLPVVAIGGINEASLAAVVGTGVHAVAVISAITTRQDMRAAAEVFVRAFEPGVPR